MLHVTFCLFERTRPSNVQDLGEKSRDEVRLDIFGATSPRRIRFTENIQLYACGRSILNRILMKQMKNEVSVRRKCGNSGNDPHLRGKIDEFCKTGLWRYYYGNTNAVS
jgi:hypothetical protein